MTIALTTPTAYDAANRWLSGRANVLTSMSARELALSPGFDAAAKAQAFFSARVAEAHILERLRDVSTRHSSGQIDLASGVSELKTFLWGEGYDREDVSGATKAGAGIVNLASAARLKLILTQQSRMAAAVAERETASDPDIKERFPYARYLPSTSRNRREEHEAFYNIVLPVDDPFWSTHTPPLDYNCQCGRELLTAEEAAGYGVGEAKPVKSDDPAGDWTVSRPDGSSVAVPRPPSGYIFDVDAAFRKFDIGLVASPELRLDIADAAQIEFGDQVQIKGQTATLLPMRQPYKQWYNEGLKSAKTWQNIPSAPKSADEADALERLQRGIAVTAVDGLAVVLGKAILDHWTAETDKNDVQIKSRLRKLDWAVETVATADEQWWQYRQRIYLKLFRYIDKRGKPATGGCLVAVTDGDNQGRTYFAPDVRGFDKARKGVKYKIYRGSDNEK